MTDSTSAGSSNPMTALESARETIARMPVRREPLGGQMFSYVKLSEVLDVIDVALATAPETAATQPPDSRGDCAIWVLTWLALKGGLGHEVHDVIDAVMEGRAVMRPNNRLHIEPRDVLKASTETSHAPKSLHAANTAYESQERAELKACEHDWRDHPTFKDWQSCSRCTLFRRAAVNGGASHDGT